jgi:orotate phosphoribosyltransferase-like protein
MDSGGKEKAMDLHENGWSYTRIADYLYVSVPTVKNWIRSQV